MDADGILHGTDGQALLYGHGYMKLRGTDIYFMSVMLDKLKIMLQELMNAKEVHLLSCPYDGSFAGPTLKAYELKAELKQSDSVFVFDPNTEMEMFALSRFYDEQLQSKRWLEIWAELALVVQEMRQQRGNKSAFHFLCCQKPPPIGKDSDEYEWELWEKTGLKGNAQHGELRMAALAGSRSKCSGLHFHVYDPEEEPSSVEAKHEREMRNDKNLRLYGSSREPILSFFVLLVSH